MDHTFNHSILQSPIYWIQGFPIYLSQLPVKQREEKKNKGKLC